MPNAVRLPLLLAAALAASACATVRQDQVGVKRTFGKVSDRTVPPGAAWFTPGAQSVVRVPSRTVNREVRLELPSKEGLNVAAEVSILYRVKPDMAPAILRTAGESYEDVLILPVFRSAAADVTARFFAKDMYSGERTAIEKAVQQQMTALLDARGFVVEQVLLKSIRLPAGLAQAVEDKLAAEQRAEQMRFVLERERQEAERKRIEAEGVRASQQIIGAGLTPMLLSFESIRAFRELATSPNAKVIMTDGRTPYLLGEDPLAALPAPTRGTTFPGSPERATPQAAALPTIEVVPRGGRATKPAPERPPAHHLGSP